MQDLTKIETEYLQAHEGDITDAEFDAEAMARYHAAQTEKVTRYATERLARLGLITEGK
jgi:hypothetical protein